MTFAEFYTFLIMRDAIHEIKPWVNHENAQFATLKLSDGKIIEILYIIENDEPVYLGAWIYYTTENGNTLINKIPSFQELEELIQDANI